MFIALPNYSSPLLSAAHRAVYFIHLYTGKHQSLFEHKQPLRLSDELSSNLVVFKEKSVSDHFYVWTVEDLKNCTTKIGWRFVCLFLFNAFI